MHYFVIGVLMILLLTWLVKGYRKHSANDKLYEKIDEQKSKKVELKLREGIADTQAELNERETQISEKENNL